jgi:ribosomal protein S18 acetylase RimI-like enzyme
LAAVADIMMDAFHTEKTESLRLYELADLERSFPYAEPDLHQMLVAVIVGDDDDDDDEKIAGFVDVDARPCPTNDTIQLPRPRLSNLAVHPEFRRRGIAAALVQECERFVEQIGPILPGQRRGAELWIRVEETNEAAVAMYTKNLDYEITGSSDDGRILTLHKSLA